MTTTLALFNNKGGVGKTTLTYHLAHMIARLGIRVVAVDLDPQANLTSHFVDDQELAIMWAGDSAHGRPTIAGAVQPIVEGLGDVQSVAVTQIDENLWLLPGDLDLSSFEERLAQEWPASLTGGSKAAFRTTTAFHRIVQNAAAFVGADLIMLDVGPNLGALNRSALLAAEHVLVPLGADLFSAQGLRNLGPSLGKWRHDWQDTALPRAPRDIDAPAGRMNPLGYVVMQPSVRLDRPARAYQVWVERIPQVYARAMNSSDDPDPAAELATIRNYRSLMPLAHEARKPMFDLRAADGAIGSTQRYVQVCFTEFRELARTVLSRLGLPTDLDREHAEIDTETMQ